MPSKDKREIKKLIALGKAFSSDVEIGEAARFAQQLNKLHKQMLTETNFLGTQVLAQSIKGFNSQLTHALHAATFQLPDIQQLPVAIPPSVLTGLGGYTAQMSAVMDALQLPAESHSVATVFQLPVGFRALIEATSQDLGKYAAASQAASLLAHISPPSGALEEALLGTLTTHNMSEFKSAMQATYEMREAFKSEAHGAFSIGASNQFIRSINAATKQESFEALLKSLEVVIQQSTKSEDFRFWLGMFFQIFMILINQYSSMQTEERLMDKMGKSEQYVIEKIEESEERIVSQIELVKKHPGFVVTAKLNLRTGPSENHRIIQVLSPNQPVTYISMKGEWMKIEFFDYIDNVPVNGWVHRNYLKPVERF